MSFRTKCHPYDILYACCRIGQSHGLSLLINSQTYEQTDGIHIDSGVKVWRHHVISYLMVTMADISNKNIASARLDRTHTRTRTHAHAHTRARTQAHERKRKRKSIRKRIDYAYAYAYAYANANAYAYAHAHAHAHAHAPANAYAYAYANAHANANVYTYTHIQLCICCHPQAYWYEDNEIAAMLDQGASLSPGTHTSVSLDFSKVTLPPVMTHRSRQKYRAKIETCLMIGIAFIGLCCYLL